MHRRLLFFAVSLSLLALAASTSFAEKPQCQSASCPNSCASGNCKSTQAAHVAIQAQGTSTSQDAAAADSKCGTCRCTAVAVNLPNATAASAPPCHAVSGCASGVCESTQVAQVAIQTKGKLATTAQGDAATDCKCGEDCPCTSAHVNLSNATAASGTTCQAGSGCASGICKSTQVAQVAIETQGGLATTAQEKAAADCKCGEDCPAAAHVGFDDAACACGTACQCAASESVAAEGGTCGTCLSDALASNATDADSCQCGSDCQCAASTAEDFSARLAVFHWRLVEEITKNAALEAQLRVREELARLKEEFSRRMLDKETEIAQLHARLQLARERNEMSQKLVGAVAENARLKASVELTHDRFELLKQKISEKRLQQTETLTTALSKSRDHNAKLMEQISVLEKQLQMLRVRLAATPEQDEPR